MFTEKGSEIGTVVVADTALDALGLPQRFSVRALIGRGGMGDVYRAIDSQLERDVAIKLLHADLAATAEGQRRFLREARTLATLAHPHILKIHMFGITEGTYRPFQVSDCLEGESLAEFLARERVLAVAEFEVVFGGILQALEYASSKGIVHRDIKPSNIFLCRDAEGLLMPILLDFGIASIESRDGGKTVTASGAMLGSPQYMSPEQIRGEAVDTTSDIYSIGIVMYECLTGAPPFGGQSALETMYQRMASSVPTLNSYLIGRKCDLALSRIVLSCLQKDRKLRPQGFSALRNDLAVAMKEIPEGVVFNSRRTVTKSAPLKVLLSIACTAALLIACGVFAMKGLESIRMQEAKSLLHPKTELQRDSTEELEAIAAKAQRLFDLGDKHDKEISAKLLFSKLTALRWRYWSESMYEKWYSLNDRVCEPFKYMVNGKSKQVDYLIDNFHRTYKIATNSIDASEKQKWLTRSHESLTQANLLAPGLENRISNIAVSHTRLVDLSHQGRFKAAKKEYLSSWNALKTAERSVGTEFFFGGDVREDWRPHRVSDTLEHLMEEAAWNTGDDPLSLCEVIAPLADYLEKQHEKAKGDRAKVFAEQKLKAAYPEPPVDEVALARYRAVRKALKTTAGTEDRNDFWGKHNMRSVY
ncbi:MAG: serine/threonine protein kinase [Candidatus Obscuribacterales bacterium]|nr:serine/threonine protein kinase [Candidatus Obscuribacterales bacterium]